MTRRAVFLDRDGALIEHYDYLTDPSQVHVLPCAPPALRRLKDRGFALVLVTNQSAIARGMLTEPKLAEIHDRLKAQLAEQGAYLDQIYYCPCHPEGAVAKYRRETDLRKPAPGMLLLAARELDLDLAQSWAVGDDDRDIEAGRRAGCRTILLDSHSTSPLVRRGAVPPDYRAVNLLEAANLIIRYADSPAAAVPEQPAAQPQPPAAQPSPPAAEPPPPTAEPPPPAAEPSPPAPAVERQEGTRLSDGKPQNLPPPARQSPTDEALASQQREPAAWRVRWAEIARRKQHQAAQASDQEPADESPPGSNDAPSAEQFLAQILRELKTLTRQQSFGDFSVAKLLAGVMQMVVVLCLVLTFKFALGAEPRPEATQNCLLLALVFQTFTLTLLVMHRQQ